jgi:hypothetical protein
MSNLIRRCGGNYERGKYQNEKGININTGEQGVPYIPIAKARGFTACLGNLVRRCGGVRGVLTGCAEGLALAGFIAAVYFAAMALR